MPYEEKDGFGAVFVNRRKEPGSQQPDFRGSGMFGGVEMWVSGWRKKTQKGETYISLAFSPKDEAKSGRGAGRAKDEDEDDGIPF